MTLSSSESPTWKSLAHNKNTPSLIPGQLVVRVNLCMWYAKNFSLALNIARAMLRTELIRPFLHIHTTRVQSSPAEAWIQRQAKNMTSLKSRRKTSSVQSRLSYFLTQCRRIRAAGTISLVPPPKNFRRREILVRFVSQRR